MKARLTRTTRRVVSLVATVAVVLALVSVNAASAKGNAPQRSDTTYEFVGEFSSDRGGVLVWQGTISGDFAGCIQWWSIPPEELRTTGQASHYDELWEIWERCVGHEGQGMVLTGTDRGTTTVRHFENSIWRANGIVTGPQDSELVGRRMHSGGTVEWLFIDGMPVPVKGEGVFRVN